MSISFSSLVVTALVILASLIAAAAAGWFAARLRAAEGRVSPALPEAEPRLASAESVASLNALDAPPALPGSSQAQGTATEVAPLALDAPADRAIVARLGAIEAELVRGRSAAPGAAELRQSADALAAARAEAKAAVERAVRAEAQVADRDRQLAEREKRLGALEGELGRERGTATSASAELRTKNDALAAARAGAKAASDVAARFEKQVAEKDVVLAERERRLGALEAELSRLSGGFESAQSAAFSAKTAMEIAHGEARSLREEVRVLQDRLLHAVETARSATVAPPSAAGESATEPRAAVSTAAAAAARVAPKSYTGPVTIKHAITAWCVDCARGDTKPIQCPHGAAARPLL